MFKVSCNISTKIIQPLKSQLYFEINEALNTPASILYFFKNTRPLKENKNTSYSDSKTGFKILKPFSVIVLILNIFSYILTKVEKRARRLRLRIRLSKYLMTDLFE